MKTLHAGLPFFPKITRAIDLVVPIKTKVRNGCEVKLKVNMKQRLTKSETVTFRIM